MNLNIKVSFGLKILKNKNIKSGTHFIPKILNFKNIYIIFGES